MPKLTLNGTEHHEGKKKATQQHDDIKQQARKLASIISQTLHPRRIPNR
jgi:hypothetical protein